MEYLSLFREVLSSEARALEKASLSVTEPTVDLLLKFFGRLLENNSKLAFCGVGKSGIVARKLASTFTSLGRPSFFLHPTEALHGDLGLLESHDGIVLLSKSGNTEEIFKMLPYLAIQKENIVGLLGDTKSALASKCGIVLDCSVEKEACINNQAPTTSSTLAMAMGDAMAVLYEKKVGLSKEGFAENHPGGMLGKALRMRVEHIMWEVQDCPVVKPGTLLKDVLLVMTSKNLGGCAVLDDKGRFLGMIVEGDIRRTFTTPELGLETPVERIMNKNPISITPEALAYEALELMEGKKGQIYVLPVIKDSKFYGMLRMHDLVREGFQIK